MIPTAPEDPAKKKKKKADKVRSAAGISFIGRILARASAGLAFLMIGDEARASAVLAQLNAQRPRPAAALARWNAAAGNRDRALDTLGELAARNPAGLQPLKNDPLLDSVRSDPRFEALLRRAAARLESQT